MLSIFPHTEWREQSADGTAALSGQTSAQVASTQSKD